MLSETLTAGLEHYEIGPKIRALRWRKKLGLVQLGQHTGLSPALLSKIERGQLLPTLPTLLRVAIWYGRGCSLRRPTSRAVGATWYRPRDS
jgi:transcriptional regulator with XRE-family HTH domain